MAIPSLRRAEGPGPVDDQTGVDCPGLRDGRRLVRVGLELRITEDPVPAAAGREGRPPHGAATFLFWTTGHHGGRCLPVGEPVGRDCANAGVELLQGPVPDSGIDLAGRHPRPQGAAGG